MLVLLLYAAVIVAWRWPRTVVGQVLHRLFADWPARRLAKVDLGRLLPRGTSGRVALVLLVAIGIALTIAVFRHDSLLFLAQSLPEGVAWFATFDIATYLDVVALGLVLGATVRLRALHGAVKAWVARAAGGRKVLLARGARSRSPRPERKAPPPSNDDEPAGVKLGLAFG